MLERKRSVPEPILFAFVSLLMIVGFLHESLLLGRIFSPADILFTTKSFRSSGPASYEPLNRLLIDPVLQFQPWIAFNREQLHAGRLPLWNPYAGCGAPHLANGQSAVFDPFLLPAYLGSLPEAFAWIALLRLWFASLGMYALVRFWGWGAWGRWFSGLTFPLCGFLVVWLEYPVVSSAVWLPWLVLASELLVHRPTPRSLAATALCTAGCLLGGHVQTSAHVLLFVGCLAVYRGILSRPKVAAVWFGAICLGVAIAAVEVVPLAHYLSRSPVWADRSTENRGPSSFSTPRLADSVCTALPYAYGSQRRGHPHLAKAIGAENLNESSGAFVGLATLLWLAPASWKLRRERSVIGFLVAAAVFGWLASLRMPIVDNLLRAIPVIDVMDHRRMSLWTAFALSALGGAGIDAVARGEGEVRRITGLAWVLLAAVCLVPAVSISRFEPMIQQRARAHYAAAAASTPGADPAEYRARADRQTRETLRFVPRYYSTAAIQLLALASIAGAIRCASLSPMRASAFLFVIVLADLWGFGLGLNPAIPRESYEARPPILSILSEVPGARILALGDEWPPNTAMRFGLSDVRNYDSIEVARYFDWFEPIYEPNSRGSRTSRREVTWERVERSVDRLVAAGVCRVISPAPPPPGAFDRVREIEGVWVVDLPGDPVVSLPPAAASPGSYLWTTRELERLAPGEKIVVREIAMPGWRAEVDGRRIEIDTNGDPFMKIPIEGRPLRVELRYVPIEVEIGVWTSCSALMIAVFALTLPPEFRSTRIVGARLGRNHAAGVVS